MGAKLAFTRIKASFVAFSSIMADSICSLIRSLSFLLVANALLVSSTCCKAASSLACIDRLSAFLTVISRFSFANSFVVAWSTRRGTASSHMSLEACCANLSHSAYFATGACSLSSSCFCRSKRSSATVSRSQLELSHIRVRSSTCSLYSCLTAWNQLATLLGMSCWATTGG